MYTMGADVALSSESVSETAELAFANQLPEGGLAVSDRARLSLAGMDNRWTRVLSLCVLLSLTTLGCASSTTKRLGLPELQTVEHVDLKKYAGVWYEIANYPNRFQKGCFATTATYTLRDDGRVEVVNRCRKESPNGPEKTSKGQAKVVDATTNAKLKVSFFWPFWGDYWIIELDPDYRYAVVGHPDRDYLWILSRSPTMDEGTYEGIQRRLKDQGYDPGRLVRTLH